MKNNKEFTVERRSAEYLHEAQINHPTCFVSSEIYQKYGFEVWKCYQYASKRIKID